MSNLRQLLPLLVSALAIGPSIAQACAHYPGNTPGTGTPDPRPLGNGNPTDPTYGTMRYQVQIPTAVLGTQSLNIVELFVAPADSQVRTFAELQVRFGHNPNPIGTQMVLNLPGFTARPVQHNNIVWSTTANQWTPLGMAFPFTYNPANGMLVLEFFVRGAGASGGSGIAGMRTDPSIPFVWTSGQGYNGTAVAGGGLKLRLCTDHYGYLEYGTGGCPGSNSLIPTLTYGGSPQIGNTVQVQLTNGPGPAPALVLLAWSLVPRVGAIDLAVLGAPGCDLWVFADVTTTYLTTGGAITASLPLAPGLPGGFPVWNQWFCVDPPANTFGLTSSNLGRFMIGYQ